MTDISLDGTDVVKTDRVDLADFIAEKQAELDNLAAQQAVLASKSAAILAQLASLVQ